MKSSYYNLFVETKDPERFVVYNTLSGAISLVDRETKIALQKNEFPENIDCFEPLKRPGFVVDDSFDEKKYYKCIHNRYKHNNSYQHFVIILTYDCNFRCPYCYQGVNKSKQPLSDGLLESAIKCIKKTCVERGARELEITLYGGEPFLFAEKCKKLVEETSAWAKENQINFYLSALTNGSLLSKETVNWLSGYGAKVQIPLDGYKDVHDTYRFFEDTKKGSYEDLMRVFSYFKGTNAELHLRISVTTQTYPTMERMLEDLKKRGLTHVIPDFCYITSFVEACNSFSKYCLQDSELYSVLPELWRMAIKKGFRIDVRPKVSPLPCSSIADGSFVIDPFGDIYKCWELVIQKNHAAGKLNPDGSIDYAPPYFEALARDPLLIEDCKDCKMLPACSGGCICKANHNSGTYHASGCGSVRYLLIEQLKVYLLQEYPEKFAKMICAENSSENKKMPPKNRGCFVEIIEAGSKPNISHCYVLV